MILLEAAKELGVSALELEDLPVWWRNVAITKISVERGAQNELEERALAKAKARRRAR